MATTSINTALNWVALTEPVQKIMAALPNVLPDAFFSNTENVLGDSFRRMTFRPTRKTARAKPYGSPPTSVPQTGAGFEEVRLVHSIEQIEAGAELMKLLMQYDQYAPQKMANDELFRRAQDFAARAKNMRTTCVNMAVANGYIFFDSNGNIETTDQSGSGGWTVDYRVPGGNRAAAAVDFSSAAANVVNWIVGFQRDFFMATGRQVRHAICGKNVSQYLANNTQFQTYLRYQRSVSDQYIFTGILPGGMDLLGMKWTFAHQAFYEKDSGTITKIFDDDQITFLPEIDQSFYAMKQGSIPVPKAFNGFQMSATLDQIKDTILADPVYGATQYSYGLAVPVPQIYTVQVDTFLPDFKVANAMYFIDTTP